MCKLLIFMKEREYPFALPPSAIQQKMEMQVQQTFPSPKNSIFAKANFIRNLKNKYLIKVEALLEEDNAVYVFYEVVPTQLKECLAGATTFLINKIASQMQEFGRFLSNIGVRVQFELQRFGLTEKQALKYFMGLDFNWEEDPDEQSLQQFYSQQISELLKPYRKFSTPDNLLPGTTEPPPFSPELHRKVSNTTLPSKDSKNKHHHQIPSCDIDRSSNDKSTKQQLLHSNNFEDTPSSQRSQKTEKRKLSGDFNVLDPSIDQPSENQIDIKSQYWNHRHKQELKEIDNPDDHKYSETRTGTSKTKSLTEEMKEKEYKEMLTLNKAYLRDFMEVLEEAEEHNVSPAQESDDKAKNIEHRLPFRIKTSLSTSIMVETTTEELLEMAHRVLEHSGEVIQNFRKLFCAN